MKRESDPPPSRLHPVQVEATAAVWLSLRDRGMNESETAEFIRWMQQDARHAETFNLLDRIWRDFNRAAFLRTPGSDEPDIELLAPRPRQRNHRLMFWGVLAAAAACVLVWAGFHAFAPPRPTAETPTGAFQRLELLDGSVVQLNTASAVQVRYTDAERRVKLLHGEAFFAVAKNPNRPFIVDAGGVEVRAVGTAFNVRMRPEAVEVLVTEGKVAVGDRGTDPGLKIAGSNPRGTITPGSSNSPVAFHVDAGERALIPTQAAGFPAVGAPAPIRVEPLGAPMIERALAWQERRLEFEATPLAEVVAEFNRYNRHQLIIADPRLAGKQFGGNFRADGYEAFVNVLESSFGVMAEREDGRTVLRGSR